MRRVRAVGENAVPDWVAREARKFEYPDFDTFSPAVAPGGGGGAPTIVIAASNSIDLEKSKADFVCSGVNDQDVIQQALDELLFGGRILLCAGTFSISFNGSPNCVETNGFSGVTLEGMGTGATLINVTDSFSGSQIDQFAFEFTDANSTVRNLSVIGLAVGGAATNGIALGNQSLSSNTIVWVNGIGIQMADGEVIVESTQIISNGDGVLVHGDGGHLINNHIEVSGSAVAVRVANIKHAIVAGNNTIGGDGIVVTDADECEVFGNVVEPGDFQDNTLDGIRLDGDSNENYVHGNYVVKLASAVNQPRYGINIAHATCDCNIVVGNALGPVSDYGTDALNDAGTNTQLTYPNDPTYGDNFTDCPTSP